MGSLCYSGLGRYFRFFLFYSFLFTLLATYEATLCAGVLNAKNNGNNIVYFTQVGGGAFGNSRTWIETAMRRVFKKYRDYNLDVRIVCYGSSDHWIDR
jgi:hypothetical protein